MKKDGQAPDFRLRRIAMVYKPGDGAMKLDNIFYMVCCTGYRGFAILTLYIGCAQCCRRKASTFTRGRCSIRQLSNSGNIRRL